MEEQSEYLSSSSVLSIKMKEEKRELVLSSAANSPCSSAFVSALQSPYISPRLAPAPAPAPQVVTTVTTTTTSTSGSGSSSSDQEESTSYTPPSDPYELTSFSFPTFLHHHPHSSSISNNTNSKLRSCDVYIGGTGTDSSPPGLLTFCRWLKAELELQGIACFRASHSHPDDVADRLACSASLGLLLLTPAALASSRHHIRFFHHKNNLIPIFFAFPNDHADDHPILSSSLARFRAFPDGSNWRRCVRDVAAFLRAKLGRTAPNINHISSKNESEEEEVPFRLSPGFVGREAELEEMEEALGRCRTRGAVVCVAGPPGVGKTELAAQWAHRHSQRYKAVLWLNGEPRHLAHNVLQLSLRLGLDVTPDPDTCTSRIRSLEEQESEGVRRVKRELFGRDIPYLVVLHGLDSPHHILPANNNTGASHLIIIATTAAASSSAAAAAFHTLHLRPLTPPHSLSLLLQLSSSTPDQTLAALDRRLAGLPFALVLATSLLSLLSLKPSSLLQALESTDGEDDEALVGKLVGMCLGAVGQAARNMAEVGAWLAPTPVPATLMCPTKRNKKHLSSWHWRKWFGKDEAAEAAEELVRVGLARRGTARQIQIQIHPIAAHHIRMQSSKGAKEAVLGVSRMGGSWEQLWGSAFLVFGYKGEAPAVELTGDQLVDYIKKRAVPLAKTAFATLSRCNSAVELLKVCTEALEELEKSFVSQIQHSTTSNTNRRSLLLCLGLNTHRHTNTNTNTDGRGGEVDEYMWQDVTLMKATLLETRAKMVLRGGYFESAEELCRTCISIRTVMLGHDHNLTLAAHNTLAKIVRIRTNFL